VKIFIEGRAKHSKERRKNRMKTKAKAVEVTNAKNGNRREDRVPYSRLTFVFALSYLQFFLSRSKKKIRR